MITTSHSRSNSGTPSLRRFESKKRVLQYVPLQKKKDLLNKEEGAKRRGTLVQIKNDEIDETSDEENSFLMEYFELDSDAAIN